MTSQQDTELREILQDFILVYVLDEQKHLSRPETKTKEWFDSQFEDTMNEAIAVLTSWKDKEVKSAWSDGYHKGWKARKQTTSEGNNGQTKSS